jgi:hypothetical protein
MAFTGIASHFTLGGLSPGQVRLYFLHIARQGCSSMKSIIRRTFVCQANLRYSGKLSHYVTTVILYECETQLLT